MLKKKYSKTGKDCQVTFALPAEVQAETVALCGDFNDWDTGDTPMKKLKTGGFSATVSLEAGRVYRFRYLMDGSRWENDWHADAYVPNQYGSDDSVVKL
jgi:1,4-alpha-glucan branching enzyme